MSKTNATRIVESLNINHKVVSYEFDENDLTGETAALKTGADPESVFKTLVCEGDNTGYLVFCIPVTLELDLKKAAHISGNKKVETIKLKDLFPLTGYLRGGCSPIGMKKHFPVFIDETAQLFEKIYVSAGARGKQLLIAPDDLLIITKGSYAEVV